MYSIIIQESSKCKNLLQYQAGIKYILYYLYLTVLYVENFKKKKFDKRLQGLI